MRRSAWRTLVAFGPAALWLGMEACVGEEPVLSPSPDGGAQEGGQGIPGDAAGGDTPCGERKACFGECVSRLDPNFGCNAPGCDPCDLPHALANSACPGGACSIASCEAPFEDCNANASDGCETDLLTAAACGDCTRNCALSDAGPICSEVDGGYRCVSECPEGRTKCGSVCADTLTNLKHCGRCDAGCPPVQGGTATCVQGKCVPKCASGLHPCSVDSSTVCKSNIDPAACGPSCIQCPKPRGTIAKCVAGKCALECDTANGYNNCDGNLANGCERVGWDDAHCLGCNAACGAAKPYCCPEPTAHCDDTACF